MKLILVKSGAEKCYVARIKGLDARYRFRREFLDGERREVRAKGDQPVRTRYTHELSDGLYEICEADERSFLAVVNNRRIPITTVHMDDVEQLCNQCHYNLLDVFDSWAKSRRRSTDSFAQIARDLTEVRRAKIEQERQEAKRRNAAHEAKIKKERKDTKKRESARRKERVRTMTAREAFEGSNAADTRAFLKRLEQSANEGAIAAQLFRCQKSSTRAKEYRGDYVGLAYDRKGEALQRLCQMLEHAPGVAWGWKEDPTQEFAPWVLYVDLPRGQVSFHSPERYSGPDYAGDWDGQHESEARILSYCDSLIESRA